MNRSGDNGPYLLGLDLGVQSIGWALFDVDGKNQPTSIRATGVRCFDSGVGTETQIEQGKDESANASRRQARQQRRQTFRRAQRLRRVFRVLQSAGLLPHKPSQTPEQRHILLQQLDAELAAEHVAQGDRLAGHTLPYRLRAAALDGPLSPHALGRALYHLAQRRGFLSNKKAAKESDEEEGKVKEGIATLARLIEEANARTLGEYFARLDPEEQRIRGRWTSRRMYLDEFEAIWAAQAPYHVVLDDVLKKRLHRAVFFQRPLKSQKGLIAECDLEPGQRRAPMASLAAQRFRYLQKLNDLEIIDPEGECLKLTPEQRLRLIEAFETQAEASFSGIRKLLGLNKKSRGASQGHTFNLEAGGETKVLGNRTAAKLSKILDGRWTALDETQRENLVHEILSFENEEALARRLVKAWDMDEQTAAQVAAVRLEPGYCELSLRAIRKLLPMLETGVRLNTARKELYGEQLLEGTTYDLLPPVLDAVRSLRNPVVCRALTELRKVVNALIRIYGKPAMVRVELARDMKRGRKTREDAFKQSRANEKRRDEAKRRILAETGIDAPSPGDVLKVVLAEECNWECPYTGKRIEMRSLIGKNPQFDVEHILPFSRSLDNSFLNKTLCYHEENRRVKKNRTPHEAYSADPGRWGEILERVRRFQGDPRRRKLGRFRMEAIPEDFVSRQLNDTRYLSRLAADYLGLLFGGRIDAERRQRVQVSSGGVTGYLRDVWQLDQILQDPSIPDAVPADGPGKNRHDHRHHAVDAVVVGLAGPATVKLLSQAAEAAEDRGHRLFVPVDEPWTGFRDEVRHSVGEIRVSYRIDRRVSGALHEETNYGKPRTVLDARGQEVQRHFVRKPLAAMSVQEVGAIEDLTVRQLVQRRLEKLGGVPKKAFTDANNLPYLKARDGRIIPIRKARIAKTVGTIRVGRESAPRYVAPGSNHHVEIVAVLDAAGKEKRWEGHLVSLFEATQRLSRGEPVIRRDHGDNRRFKFSLAGGEFVEMEHQPGEPRLFRVVGISAKVLEFRLHTDARPSTVLRGISRARITRSPGSLHEAKARKVAVDPLGNILPAHD